MIFKRIGQLLKVNYQFIIFVIVIYFLFQITLPYYIYAPGGYIALDERIIIKGEKDYPGELGMAYVSMFKANIPSIILAAILPNWDVMKATDVLNEKETDADMEYRDKIAFNSANSNAIIAAFALTDRQILITDEQNIVVYITPEATTNLKIGDQIISFAEQSAFDFKQLTTYIKEQEVGTIVNLKVKRQNKIIKTTAKVYEDQKTKYLGLQIIKNYVYQTNPTVTINFEKDESGPSGGLMTALAIYEDLTNTNLTQGRKIIGTGTIDSDGQVGEIGGIKYKLLGARKAHAEMFICPLENLAEALKIKKQEALKIDIIGVHTLEEAINVLKGNS